MNNEGLNDILDWIKDDNTESIDDFKAKLEKFIVDKRKKLSNDEVIKELKKGLLVYKEENNFEVGDLVRWKSEMKNRAYPGLDEPAIVVELLDNPIINEDESPYSPYFMERLDLVVGIFDQKRESIIFIHVDKKRFEKI